MIKNLNVFTFSSYGEILLDRLPNRGFPEEVRRQEMIVSLSASESYVMRYESEDIYVDFEYGMVVLGVTHEEDQQVSYFYLDKPVHIAARTGYMLAPYNESATIRIARRAESQIIREVIMSNALNLKITPKLEIKNVCTLFYQEKERNFLFKGEQHKMFELTYVDKGSLHSVISGTDYVLEQGELMIYGPEQWHMQYSNGDTSVSFITITFEMDFADAAVLLNRKFTIGSGEVKILKKLMAETEQVYYLSDDMILCNLKEFILHILRLAVGSMDGAKLETTIYNNSSNEIVERALKYMTDHIYTKLTVASVSKTVNVSPAYLAALFKKCLQTTPSEYISKLKLEESKRLIREGKLNFTQISETLNFATIHHFSRRFKEKYGVTPTEYAKAMR